MYRPETPWWYTSGHVCVYMCVCLLFIRSAHTGVDDHLDDIRGLCAGRVRAAHEPVLVLEPGEAVPAVR